MGCVAIGQLQSYADLSSVPAHRQLRDNELVAQMRKSIGFRHLIVGGLDIEGYHYGTGRSVDTDMPPAYIDAYFGERLGFADPVVTLSKTRGVAVSQEDAFDDITPPPRLQSLLRAYEVRHRFLIPIVRDGIVYGGVCFTNDRCFTEGERQLLAFLAPPLHKAVTKPLMERFAAAALRLSEGEVRCLELAGRGRTSEEIAALTEYQKETVDTYLKRATRKLGAENRAHAIAEAIRRDIIT